MGRKLEQFTRSDSKDQIHFPLGSTRSRKRNYTLNQEVAPSPSTVLQVDHQARKPKIDRVESIRNLFKRSRSWDSSKDLDDCDHIPKVSTKSKTNSPAARILMNRKKNNAQKQSVHDSSSVNLHPNENNILYRSVSTSFLPLSDDRGSCGTNSTLNRNCDIERDFSEKDKKGQFPYAFLRSKLSSVSEEFGSLKDECGDSGRGTESFCGSVSDVRTSYSENSDSKSSSFSEPFDKVLSYSDVLETKFAKKHEGLKISATNDYCSVSSKLTFSEENDEKSKVSTKKQPENEFVLTLKVEGKATEENETPQDHWILWSDESKDKEKEFSSLKNANLLTDEEKILVRSQKCDHCFCCKSLGGCNENKFHSLATSAIQPYSISNLYISSCLDDEKSCSTEARALNSRRTSLDLEYLHKRMESIEKVIPKLKQLESKCSQLSSFSKNQLVTEKPSHRYQRSLSLDRSESWQCSLDITDKMDLSKSHLSSSITPRTNLQKPKSSFLLSHSTSSNKVFRLIRIVKDPSLDLGLLITGHRSQGYVIAYIEPGSVTDK